MRIVAAVLAVFLYAAAAQAQTITMYAPEAVGASTATQFVPNGTDERGRTQATGVYLVRMQVGDVVQTHKMALVK